ncbi:MAG: hypothetical protein HRT93_03220 [Piscirickettsiaceae bacterium]|nr:hypothetical protein [Piscirickettsiaceae bacterium]
MMQAAQAKFFADEAHFISTPSGVSVWFDELRAIEIARPKIHLVNAIRESIVGKMRAESEQKAREVIMIEVMGDCLGIRGYL